MRGRRKWLLIGLLVFVLCALAGGAAIVVRRGYQREGLYEKGLRAIRDGNPEAAETLFRGVLESDPDNAQARGQLTSLLIEDRRFDEAEELARGFLDQEGQALTGWRHLVEIELRQARFREAELIARRIADQDPEFAQLTILRVRDILGSPWDRIEAQSAALNVAALTESESLKAEMLLYAGEALLELREGMEADRGVGVERQARRHLEEATKALRRAEQLGSGSGQDLLLARIQVLSEIPRVRQVGAETLAFALRNDPGLHQIRASLAAYRIREQDWAGAVQLARELRDESYLLWLRTVRRLARADRRDEALELLADPPYGRDPLVTLLRAQVLLRGSEEEKAEAVRSLTAWGKSRNLDPQVAVAIYRVLAAGGEEEAGIDVLEALDRSEPDVRIEALIAGSRAASAENQDEAIALIEQIARRVGSPEESVEVMRLLQRGGREALRRYVAAKVEGGGELGASHRFLRASTDAVWVLRNPEAKEAEALRASILADLLALESQSTPKADLAGAWRVALAMQHPELAGRLCARAIARDGPPHGLAFTCLMLAANTKEDDMRAAVAAGLRTGAPKGHCEAFLSVVAAAVERRPDDRSALLAQLADTMTDRTSAVPALYLALQLSYLEGDAEKLEASARSLVGETPESEQARGLLGDVLLRRKKYREVLDLHGNEELRSTTGARQRVVALRALGEKDSALEEVREAVRRWPQDDRSYLLLASIHHEEGRTDEALGALSVAPPTRDVVLSRARLLVEKEEWDTAEMLFLGVLRSLPGNVDAWRGLAAVLSRQGRHDDLLGILTEALGRSELAHDTPLRAELLAQRGVALERGLGRTGEALRDYEEAIRLVPRHAIALNNAAWLILTQQPERIDDARKYVDAALEVLPGNPSVHDTAAMIHVQLEEYEAALAFIDRAIELSGRSKPSYLYNRAMILARLDRKAEALQQAKEVEERFPGDPEAKKAARLRREFDGE